MKTLIKPIMVSAFLLVLTGLIPAVPMYLPILGAALTVVFLVTGVRVLGTEDANYQHELELIRLEHHIIKDYVDRAKSEVNNDIVARSKKLEELENRVSKAISENRELAGRLR